MVFSSFVFLLAFLPIVLLLYYLCPARLRNLVLLVFSLVFYAWGEPVYVLIMLFSIVFDYANGRLIEHFKNKNCPGKAKAALIVDLCGNLAILGFFKYTDFVIGSINSITGAGLSLLHIHSFPTRRSSDLIRLMFIAGRLQHRKTSLHLQPM